VHEGLDALKQCPVQVLHDAIQLRGVMSGKLVHCACSCEMLIEGLA